MRREDEVDHICYANYAERVFGNSAIMLAFYSLLIAIAFSSWPIASKFVKLPAVWIAVLINAGTLLVAFIYMFAKPAATPSAKSIVIALGIAVVNGLGFVLYSYLLANGGETSRIGPLVNVIAPIVVVIAGVLILREPLTATKIDVLPNKIRAIFVQFESGPSQKNSASTKNLPCPSIALAKEG